MPLDRTTIRPATSDDSNSLARLAALSGRLRPRGQALVADVNGDVVAAIGITSGAVVADPSHFNPSAVKMLRRGRYHLLHQGGDVVAAWRLLRHRAIALS